MSDLAQRVIRNRYVDHGRPAEHLRLPFWELINCVQIYADLYPHIGLTEALESTMTYLETNDAYHGFNGELAWEA